MALYLFHLQVLKEREIERAKGVSLTMLSFSKIEQVKALKSGKNGKNFTTNQTDALGTLMQESTSVDDAYNYLTNAMIGNRNDRASVLLPNSPYTLKEGV